MTSCFTSEINASSGIRTRTSAMARAWAFRSPPVTASAAAADAEAKAREYQRFVDDLKIAAEVLSKSARAA